MFINSCLPKFWDEEHRFFITILIQDIHQKVEDSFLLVRIFEVVEQHAYREEVTPSHF